MKNKNIDYWVLNALIQLQLRNTYILIRRLFYFDDPLLRIVGEKEEKFGEHREKEIIGETENNQD